MTNDIRGRDRFQKHKRLIFIIIKFASFLPTKTKIMFFNHIRNYNGILGILLRYVFLKSLSHSCGDNVSIHSGVYLFHINKLKVGNNVSIHPMCYIDAAGEIEIGNDVSIAHNTTIMSTEHNYSDRTELIKNQGCSYNKTIIKSNVWIGAGCRILAGSLINEGSIIASGAVIKNVVEGNCIYGGVPGKKIKER
jgi:acetyltransferase-like isoleucine patch superfamily enzyme